MKFTMLAAGMWLLAVPPTSNDPVPSGPAYASDVADVERSAGPEDRERFARAARAPEGSPAPSAAGKACSKDELVFHCRTTNRKEIRLCDRGSTIFYSFGSPGAKPDLQLSVPREQAWAWKWEGIGRFITYSVSVPNGDVHYTVFTSADRSEQEFEAGVSVEKDEEEIARVICREPVLHNIEDIELRSNKTP